MSQLTPSSPQKILLLLITIMAVSLTTLSAVGNDETEPNNANTTSLASQPDISASGQQKIFRKGDTLTSILKESRVVDKDILDTNRLLAKKVNLNRIHVGQTLDLYLRGSVDDNDYNAKIVGLILHGNGKLHWTIVRSLSDKLVLQKLSQSQALAAINSSLGPRGSANTKASFTHTLTLGQGDTLISLLRSSGLNEKDIKEAIKALAPRLDLRRLPVNQTFALRLQSLDGRIRLVSLTAIRKSSGNVTITLPLKEDEPFSNNGLVTELREETAAISTHPASPNVTSSRPDIHNIDIIKIMPGDTLETILRKQRVSPKEAHLALRSLNGIYNSDNIRAGQKIALQFNLAGGEYKLQQMILGIPSNKTIVIEYGEDNYKAYHGTAALMETAIQADRHLTSLQAELKSGKPSQTVLEHYGFDIPDNALVKAKPRQPSTVLIREGDTLFDALVNSGVKPVEAEKAISAARKLTNPRRLKPGQTLHLFFGKATTSIPSKTGIILAELSIDLNVKQRLRVARLLDGTFVAGFVARPLQTQRRKAQGFIKSSLYEAASEKNVPAKTLAKLIRIFSYDVDFQRDIREGDKFQIFYEVFIDDGGRTVDAGEILYSSLNLSGTSLNVYKFTLKDGVIDDYFDDHGQSVRKALMRTPIDGARLTSSYGNRKHPTLGYTKMHRGVDFGAPRGTPVFAAGDGVVDQLGSHGAYGNYLRLRHGHVYQTAYAHLHKFASGLHAGKRVKQGDTIGFVGSTGRSTGPHLHYEVLKHGKQVNPLGVKLPSGLLLQGNDLIKFKEERQRLLEQFTSQIGETG